MRVGVLLKCTSLLVSVQECAGNNSEQPSPKALNHQTTKQQILTPHDRHERWKQIDVVNPHAAGMTFALIRTADTLRATEDLSIGQGRMIKFRGLRETRQRLSPKNIINQGI